MNYLCLRRLKRKKIYAIGFVVNITKILWLRKIFNH